MMAVPERDPPDPTPQDVRAAAERIAEIALVTPVVPLLAGGDVPSPSALKLESLQVTGSFKVRGAANRLLTLSDEERRRGVVACSSGNHGLAVASVARRLGISATIFVPAWADESKRRGIEAQGAILVATGATYDDAEAAARAKVRETGAAWIDPFDDPRVIAGQGTVGLELVAQIDDLRTVVVPLSGGGLIAGVALGLRAAGCDARVVGVSARNADVMLRSIEAGEPVRVAEEETVATALSGGIGEANRFSFRLVRELVDAFVRVDEATIREAMRWALVERHLVVEGGGAVALGAVLAGRIEDPTTPLAIVVSGGNVAPETLREVL